MIVASNSPCHIVAVHAQGWQYGIVPGLCENFDLPHCHYHYCCGEQLSLLQPLQVSLLLSVISVRIPGWRYGPLPWALEHAYGVGV